MKGGERVTSIDDVTVSGDVVEGLRTVFLNPRNGLGDGGSIAGDDDAFALVRPRGESVVIAVDVHRMSRFRHC